LELGNASAHPKAMIKNPVLRGFNPDPSIVRVGEDYYIATSTFEWFPGVQLHHSRDLVHWRLIGHALTRTSQLDLRGDDDSGGVWAPSLSHADGQFWLIYTNVRTCGMARPFKDVEIFLTTAPDILGPWSEPTKLNSIGFDPSLFHDDDGRKWLVNMIWDFRKDRHRFGGIVVQEYDPRTRQLIGPMTNVLAKPVLTEGPNLYKRNGWYFLMLAEGGTSWNHGISMARAKSVLGPYELDPQSAVLTARDDPSLALQKAGHGELVQTPQGEWYLAHLASRPLDVGLARRCMLGRETCLQKVMWSADGWLRLAQGGTRPQIDVPAPIGIAAHPWPPLLACDDFGAARLDVNWSSLRVPLDKSWASLRERPGWLRLRGRQSLHSIFEQSLVAQRLAAFRATIETRVEFSPTHYTQMAGLICWYDTRMHYYLRITHDERLGKILGIVLTDDGAYDELTENQVTIADWPACFLRAEIDHEKLQFSASRDATTWQSIGPVLDASKLSDDYGQGLHFTGAMVGLCAQDLNGTHTPADFDYFQHLTET
jgi:xylan 1,4-beta-xylosidase